jgi:ABC-2 type transport system ATP-binding protein
LTSDIYSCIVSLNHPEYRHFLRVIMGDISRSKQIEIETSRQAILDGWKSGDLVEQCHACENLCVLAENYFPAALEHAVSVTSAFNRLDSQIRLGQLSDDDQGIAVGKLVSKAVGVLNTIVKEADSGSSAAAIPPPSVSKLKPEPAQPVVYPLVGFDDQDENEKAILDFIVNKIDPKTGGKLIAALSVSKRYRNSDFCLDNITLELNRGEILGIVGVNASGKTTLLRMLLGELRPTNGLISYPAFGEDPQRPNWAKIKQRIAYVSQSLPRWPGRLIDNLQYVASVYGRDWKEINKYLDLLLQRYGLDRFRESYWDEISGGYKTRFEIVRALLSNPDILILDEPLAYLDIISQQVVLRQLRQLAKKHERPIGIIITSQQLYEIESIADRLLVLDTGQTLFSGPVSELSRLIDDVVIEFSIAGNLLEIRQQVAKHPNCVILFASETGYIAVFRKRAEEAGSKIDFNVLLEFLAKVSRNRLSYVRDISNSCRLLFEPRMMTWLRSRSVQN